MRAHLCTALRGAPHRLRPLHHAQTRARGTQKRYLDMHPTADFARLVVARRAAERTPWHWWIWRRARWDRQAQACAGDLLQGGAEFVALRRSEDCGDSRGCGRRGAYGAGALDVLAQKVPDDVEIVRIVGASSGALNATIVAGSIHAGSCARRPGAYRALAQGRRDPGPFSANPVDLIHGLRLSDQKARASARAHPANQVSIRSS